MWDVNKDDAWFDYHGECDLVLVHNPKLFKGHRFNIHVRTTIQGIYSYIENAAIQIEEQVLEIQASKLGREIKFFLNGKDLHEPPTFFAGYQIEKLNITKYCATQQCKGADIIKIDLGVDGEVVVTNWKGFLYVDVMANEVGFIHSVGLLGRKDQPGKFARNGTVLHDVTDYAEEWQVSKTEQRLFVEDREPQSPTPCIAPSQHSEKLYEFNRRRAVDACSGLSGGAMNACLYDVMLTMDVDMALPYLVTNN